MVESKFLHIRAGSVWYVGRSIHVMHDQYLWSIDFPSHWMDGGKLESIKCLVFAMGDLFRKTSHIWICSSFLDEGE